MDGGTLSQEEINALLNGMAVPDGEASDADSSDASGSGTGEYTAKTFEIEPEAYLRDSAPVSGDEGFSLTDVERDAIGEVANISMGSSATTLYSLVNRKVNITTPEVELADWQSILQSYEKPCVFIQIKYTKGLDGTNILVLREHDVKVITDLMMGGDGTNTDGELGELHLSAISEAMNQMMGAASTSLSTMLQTMIDISPPDSSLIDLSKYASGSEISPFLAGTFVKVSFRMQIDELVDSSIMQLYPIDFAKKIVETFINNQMGTASSTPEPAPATPQPATPQPAAQQPVAPQPSVPNAGMPQGAPMMPNTGMDMMNQAQMNMQGAMPPYPYPYPYPYPAQPYPAQQYGMPMGGMPQAAPSNIQPATFEAFTPGAGNIAGQENIGLIMDVPLEVTVELGRTSKSISEILDFAPGTIIELNRIAGEPIDVLVNGKFVARGEVVVIEENFGIRVTEIIKDAKKANILP